MNHLQPSVILRVIFFAQVLALVSCQFVAPYDERFDQSVASLHEETLVFLANMNRTGGSYSANAKFYSDARGKLDVIRSRAELYGEDKNRSTLNAITLLEKAFDDLEAYHRAGPIRGNGYKAMRNTMSTHFGAVQQIEIHKKHSASLSN